MIAPVARGIAVRRPRIEDRRFIALVEESRGEGFWMLQRLLDGWRSRTERFRRRGEALLGAYDGETLAGICGLNVDPYVKARREGRLRHLYVAEIHRRRGIGRLLAEALIDRARQFFPVLNLRATKNAFGFYESLGFERVDGEAFVTHRMALGRTPAMASERRS